MIVSLKLIGLLLLGQIVAMQASADDRSSIARQQRNEARGWLQLERDQAVYRERVAPLSPSQARELGIRERMEANDKRALDLRQRRTLQSLERKARLSEGAGDLRPRSRVSGPTLRRQSDRQRLRMRIDREIRR